MRAFSTYCKKFHEKSSTPLIITCSSCFEANLNGEYFPVDGDNGYYRGIIWELWLGDNSLKAARMMVRSKGYTVI